MDRENLDYWCEKGILGLILSMVVFAVLATGAVGTLEWLVVQVLMCGVLALWIPRFWLRSNYRFLSAPMIWAVAAFAIYTIVRYTQAPVEYVARSELLQVLVYSFLFVAIIDNLHGQEETQRIAFVLIFVGMAISLYAVYQFITKSPYVWHLRQLAIYANRGSGTYICPNHLAGFLEMALPLSLAYVMTGRLKPMTKVFLAYAALAMLAGIGVSISRGGWIATAFALSLFFIALLHKRTYRLPAIVVLVLLVSGGAFFVNKTFRAQKRLDQLVEQDKFKDMRFRLWQPTVEIWKENFWWGAGPGQFDEAFRKHRPHDIQKRPLYAHNDYLNTLADYGLAGTIIVAMAMALFYYTVAKVWKFVQRTNDIGTKPSNRSALVLGGALGIVAILVHSVVDFNMHIPANALVAVVLMAMISGHARFATERFWANPGWIGKGIMTLILLAGLGFLGMETVTGARHQGFTRRAAKAKDMESRVAFLKRAAEIEPGAEAERGTFSTAYQLAETLRLWSWLGNDGYEKLATEAMQWFDLGMKLNPLDPYNFARYGMCLHWLDRHDKAAPYFQQAFERDPNNYVIVELCGWHEFQLGNYEKSKEWFLKSRELSLRVFDIPWPDKTAWIYLRAIDRKLEEKRANVP